MQQNDRARARTGASGQDRALSAGRLLGLVLALVGMLLLVNAQVARAQVDDDPDLTPIDTVPPDDTTPPDETIPPDDPDAPDDSLPTDDTAPDDAAPDDAAPDDATPTDDTDPVDTIDDPNGDGTDTGAGTTTPAPTTTTASGAAVASTSAALLSDPANTGSFTLAALPVAAAVTASGSSPVAGVTVSQAAAAARAGAPLPTTGRNSRGQLVLGLSALSVGLVVVGLTRRRALAVVPPAE